MVSTKRLSLLGFVLAAIACGRAFDADDRNAALTSSGPATSSSSSSTQAPVPDASAGAPDSAPPFADPTRPPPVSDGPDGPATCLLAETIPAPICENAFCWQNPLPQGADINAAWVDGSELWAVGGRTLLHFDGQTWTGASVEGTSPNVDDGIHALAGDTLTKTLYLASGRSLIAQPASLAKDAPQTIIGLPSDAPKYGPIDTLWYDGDGGLYVDIKPGWMESTEDVPFHRYDTRTGTWTSIPTNGRFVRGITGSGPNDIWAVGTGSLIIHWDGAVWTEVDSGTSPVYNLQLKGVAKVQDTLIVVGSEGTEFVPGAATILELGPSGWKRWLPYSFDFSLLSNIAVLGERVFVAGGSTDIYRLHRRRVLERDPVTKTWSDVCLSPNSLPLHSIVSFGSTVWAFGERGSMFERDSSGAWTKRYDDRKVSGNLGSLTGDPQKPSDLLVQETQGGPIYRWTPNGFVGDFSAGALTARIVGRTDTALWAMTDRVLTRNNGKWEEVAFPYPPSGKYSWLATASNAGDLVVVERASPVINVPPSEDCIFHYKHDGAWSTLPLAKCASTPWLAPNGDVWAFGFVPACAAPCKLSGGQWVSYAAEFADEGGASVNIHSAMQRGAGPLFFLGNVGTGSAKRDYVFSLVGGSWSRTQVTPLWAFDATATDAWAIDTVGLLHRNAASGSWEAVKTPIYPHRLLAAPDGHVWLGTSDWRLLKREN